MIWPLKLRSSTSVISIKSLLHRCYLNKIELNFYVGRLGMWNVLQRKFRWCQLRRWLKPPNDREPKLFKSHPTFILLEDQKYLLLSREIFNENSDTILKLMNEHCVMFSNAKIHSTISWTNHPDNLNINQDARRYTPN